MRFRQKIYNRSDIVNNYHAFLNDPAQKADDFLQNNSEDIIIQVSSGSRGQAIKIPRTREDINDVMTRVVRPYIDRYGQFPQKAAMLGGISHIEASSKLQSSKSQICNFSLNELECIEAFDPDIISCYPSVIRDILINPKLKLNNLKAIKLGGESVFPADINKIFKRFNNILIIEQYGSTEAPAIALRIFARDNINQPYIMQSARFDLLLRSYNGWQPIIVKDKFGQLIFKINGYYDTGDEGLFNEGKLTAIRRADDNYYAFRKSINELFELGCCNVQLFTKSKLLKYTGEIVLPAELNLNGIHYKAINEKPDRLPESNKLPLFVDL